MTDFSDKPAIQLEELPSTLSAAGLLSVQANEVGAWTGLVKKFFPMVYAWCRRAGLQPADASDVSQEVFKAVLRSIRSFHREEAGATFRGWLRRITQRRVLDYRRKQAKTASALGGSTAQGQFLAIAEMIESSHSAPRGLPQSVLDRLQSVQAEFELTTWQAFLRTTIDECSAAEVAQELGISTNAVYLAKSRVLARLRRRLADLT